MFKFKPKYEPPQKKKLDPNEPLSEFNILTGKALTILKVINNLQITRCFAVFAIVSITLGVEYH